MASDTLKQPMLRRAFAVCKSNFLFVVLFSFFINLLLFVSPLYMIQVYDRVLASRNEVTLVMVTILAVALLVVYAALESIRSRILVRTGARFDKFIGQTVFKTSFRGHLRSPGGGYSQPIRDLDTVREFLTGGGIITFCDAPWMPIFLTVCYMIHFWIGVVATIGAITIFALALANELMTRRHLKDASAASIGANQYVSTTLRNAEIIHALGMMGSISHRWEQLHDRALGLQAKASDRAGSILAVSKFVRTVLQIAILGVGAYLVLESEVTGGAMIASSIMMGRALAPVEGAVAQWKGFVATRGAYDRLSKLFQDNASEPERMPLPAPTGAISLEQLIVAPPGSRVATLKSVNMQIQPGEVIGVIGPSGAGKSTFARALTGVWPPLSGHVRLDGADIDNWHSELLGPHMGYLPQDVELFSGTIAENISRFATVDPDEVVKAAQKAGVHEMILQLPEGFNTKIGEGGRSLSGGQRQRIGLARALYGDPKIIILDEPNSSLDSHGEAALAQALRTAKSEGRTILVISHRASLLNEVDKLAVFTGGTLTMYGPTREVMERLNPRATATPATAVPAPQPMGQVTHMSRASS
ncbi:type I secretion system permease/ATPase [Aureimonas sp. Leaf454]|uniref:type I secretion system permease/ATPase n=1 Tax=Aureimonas sp. Leaf454 TaxID=1736381 RepID=UPI000AC6EBC9|nr:type I secretion system permease/ATPase [Aureimonas sp. Leaf454]